MNILLNMSTLKQGGGQNVGLNFLQFLFDYPPDYHIFFFLVAKGSSIHLFLEAKKAKNVLVLPANPGLRILNELFLNRRRVRKYHIDIVYTYFGYGIFPRSVPQVCGIAVANVFYPEMNFWSDYRGLKLLIRKLTDEYRIRGLKKASGLIFENRMLEERSHTLFSISNGRTIFIPPSINNDFPASDFELPPSGNGNKIFKILILSGWHKNKNIHIIPSIAGELKKRNLDIRFILTAKKDNSVDYLEFISLAKKLDVTNFISIIGTVKKEQLSSLYSQIDMVLLLSKLESFSNNIIESWYFNKPLVISDAEWAKGICGDAALYVKRDDPVSIANEIVNLCTSPVLCESLVAKGKNELNNYPTTRMRGLKEIAFLEKIYHVF